jgi:hypothetical protein
VLALRFGNLQTAALDLEEELRSLEHELRGVKFRDSITLSLAFVVTTVANWTFAVHTLLFGKPRRSTMSRMQLGLAP